MKGILPSLSLPPVECCLGTKPIHAATLRPDENTFQSPTSMRAEPAEKYNLQDEPQDPRRPPPMRPTRG
jgi:hypothetical protein